MKLFILFLTSLLLAMSSNAQPDSLKRITEINEQVWKPFIIALTSRNNKDLQKLQSVGLVIPVDEEHMYFAAMRSKACKLTDLGHHYWRLVQEGRI